MYAREKRKQEARITAGFFIADCSNKRVYIMLTPAILTPTKRKTTTEESIMKNQIIKRGDIFSGKQMIEIINMHSGCMVSVDGSWPEPADQQDLVDIAQLDGIHASINYCNEVQFHWEGDGQRVRITLESLKGRCEPIGGGHAVWHAVV